MTELVLQGWCCMALVCLITSNIDANINATYMPRFVLKLTHAALRRLHLWWNLPRSSFHSFHCVARKTV
jgi:hypothetical protein